jgi:hypothetical protein
MKMEIPIKEEPLFDDIGNIGDAIQCCFICKDGQSIFKEVLEHFRGTHYEGEDIDGFLGVKGGFLVGFGGYMG